MPEKIRLASTVTCPMPPRIRPTTIWITANRCRVIPDAPNSAAAKMNIGTASSGTESRALMVRCASTDSGMSAIQITTPADRPIDTAMGNPSIMVTTKMTSTERLIMMRLLPSRLSPANRPPARPSRHARGDAAQPARRAACRLPPAGKTTSWAYPARAWRTSRRAA